jgi:hypothetical protein
VIDLGRCIPLNNTLFLKFPRVYAGGDSADIRWLEKPLEQAHHGKNRHPHVCNPQMRMGSQSRVRLGLEHQVKVRFLKQYIYIYI